MTGSIDAATARAQSVATDPVEADLWVGRWMARFGVISDRALRRRVLSELVTDTDDGTLVGLLARLSQLAEAGDADARWLQTELALTPSVVAEQPYTRIADLYSIAKGANLDRIAARFLSDKPAPAVAPNNPHLDISAGERTAKARSRDRMVLDRLMHDRDPRIISALLNNPRMIERDVVRIAAMRPTSPTILESIAAHPRWAARYRVRKALAFNPHTPHILARQLLPTLLRQDLIDLRGSKVLAVGLHDELNALIA